MFTDDVKKKISFFQVSTLIVKVTTGNKTLKCKVEPAANTSDFCSYAPSIPDNENR